jgi:hypothetical protein
VVSALMLVKCAVKHSVFGVILKDISEYIDVSALIPVKCVIRHSVAIAV